MAVIALDSVGVVPGEWYLASLRLGVDHLQRPPDDPDTPLLSAEMCTCFS